jgi:hypothetical protein
MKKNEDLSKTVDDLKNEKLTLTNGILKLKKIVIWPMNSILL